MASKKDWRSKQVKLKGEDLYWTIVECAEEGRTIVETAKACGYARSTFYNWLKGEDEEFKDAMEWADTLRASHWLGLFRRAAKDKSLDGSLISKMVHNLAREEFSDKQEVELSGSIITQIERKIVRPEHTDG